MNTDEQVAIINAVDAYAMGARQAIDSTTTKLLVKDMFDQVGRGDEVAEPEWANPAEVGAMLFRLSLKRSGYELVRKDPS